MTCVMIFQIYCFCVGPGSGCVTVIGRVFPVVRLLLIICFVFVLCTELIHF